MTSPFATTAVGGAHALDRSEVARALRLFVEPGQTFELRGITSPGARSRICNGDEIDQAVESAFELSDSKGLYFTLNPCRADLDKAAANSDILCRRWLLIDVDATRAADTNATDIEKDHASEVAFACYEWLTSQGWPCPLVIDSGNGWHLLYRIDLPNDKLSQALVKAVLVALAERFDRPEAKIDRSVHNASRISKLPGSWVRKGPGSADRPHRLARIAMEPSTLDTVSIGQLQTIGQPAVKPEVNGTHLGGSPFLSTATNDRPDLAAYVARAIELECVRVVMTAPGGRNNALNTAAFNLATKASWPEMVEATARAALYAASQQAGLDPREALLTIASGWAAGAKAEQARRPEASKKQKPVTPGGSRLIIFGSEVMPKTVSWLWPNRIAIGFISIFAGRTGIGKSFVLCDFAARLTTGRSTPDSEVILPVGRVLMISEDPYDYVLAPRLAEMKADLSKIAFLTWEAMATYTLGDVAMLDQAYEEAGRPILIVIDPPANFLGSSDEHKNAEVRQVLTGLVAWISQKSVACVMITHVTKPSAGKGVEAVDRIMGSVAWASTSRIAIGFAPDPNQADRCLMAGIKNNLGPKAKTLAYQIVSTDSLAAVTWQGEVDTTADEAMNATKKKTKGANAVEWLIEQFTKQREWESTELKKNAKENGISGYALFESPEVLALPIVKRPRSDANGGSYWVWVAQEGWPIQKSESSESCSVNPCQQTESELSEIRESINDHFRKSEDPKVQDAVSTFGVSELSELSERENPSESSPKVESGEPDWSVRPAGWTDAWIFFDGEKKVPDGQ